MDDVVGVVVALVVIYGLFRWWSKPSGERSGFVLVPSEMGRLPVHDLTIHWYHHNRDAEYWRRHNSVSWFPTSQRYANHGARPSALPHKVKVVVISDLGI